MTTTPGAAVVLHPHPGMGGDHTHPLVTAVTDRLAARGLAAVSPDIGDADPGSAAAQLRSIADQLVDESGAERLVLIGYSWGSAVSSLVTTDALVARVLVAPPVGMMDVGGDDGIPTLAIVPANDQFGGPDAVESGLGPRPGVEVSVVGGADHFLAGAIDDIAVGAVDWTLRQLR